ncbi:MAG: hypothetical protein CFE28_04755 [Alphaproteobacteria bacterium PA2]|nr:MAG: hypothetical protein CFE28_04755 [Alphaproteobacteria bacterium PA2]
MGRTIIRGLVGIAGLLGLLVATRLLLQPEATGLKLGLTPVGSLGLATIRADVAGFFAVTGGLSLFAAWKNDRALILAPLLLIAAALAGRCLNLAVQGVSPELVPPMVIEAALLVLLAFGRRSLGTRG